MFPFALSADAQSWRHLDVSMNYLLRSCMWDTASSMHKLFHAIWTQDLEGFEAGREAVMASLANYGLWGSNGR